MSFLGVGAKAGAAAFAAIAMMGIARREEPAQDPSPPAPAVDRASKTVDSASTSETSRGASPQIVEVGTQWGSARLPNRLVHRTNTVDSFPAAIVRCADGTIDTNCVSALGVDAGLQSSVLASCELFNWLHVATQAPAVSEAEVTNRTAQVVAALRAAETNYPLNSGLQAFAAHQAHMLEAAVGFVELHLECMEAAWQAAGHPAVSAEDKQELLFDYRRTREELGHALDRLKEQALRLIVEARRVAP
jgi:hypothetical protein